MRIVVFGASGQVGSRTVDEAVRRGHEVTEVARDVARLDGPTAVAGDATDAASVAAAAPGHHVAISAIGPGADQRPDIVVDAARALLAGLSRAGVRRLVVAGGAGSLEVAPGVRLVDAPDFPAEWKGIALAHGDALQVYVGASTDVDWSYVSPAALLEPGERTGGYRVGGDQLLTDADGNSSLSMEDYAIALLDEAEEPKHVRQRFTVAH